MPRPDRALLIALALAVAAPAAADSLLPPAEYANKQLPDPRLEARARDLMDEIRCLVCQGQSIADSDADMAGDMRNNIRRRIAAGEQPDDIRAWLIERYGSWVSYKPTSDASTWLLWLAPLLFLAIGGWIAASRIKRSRD